MLIQTQLVCIQTSHGISSARGLQISWPGAPTTPSVGLTRELVLEACNSAFTLSSPALPACSAYPLARCRTSFALTSCFLLPRSALFSLLRSLALLLFLLSLPSASAPLRPTLLPWTRLSVVGGVGAPAMYYHVMCMSRARSW